MKDSLIVPQIWQYMFVTEAWLTETRLRPERIDDPEIVAALRERISEFTAPPHWDTKEFQPGRVGSWSPERSVLVRVSLS